VSRLVLLKSTIVGQYTNVFASYSFVSHFATFRRVGVVILHLLLVPGTAFVIGGARVIQQDLHPHLTQLNHSLLTLGLVAYIFGIDTSGPNV